MELGRNIVESLVNEHVLVGEQERCSGADKINMDPKLDCLPTRVTDPRASIVYNFRAQRLASSKTWSPSWPPYLSLWTFIMAGPVAHIRPYAPEDRKLVQFMVGKANLQALAVANNKSKHPCSSCLECVWREIQHIHILWPLQFGLLFPLWWYTGWIGGLRTNMAGWSTWNPSQHWHRRQYPSCSLSTGVLLSIFLKRYPLKLGQDQSTILWGADPRSPPPARSCRHIEVLFSTASIRTLVTRIWQHICRADRFGRITVIWKDRQNVQERRKGTQDGPRPPLLCRRAFPRS